MRLFGGCESRKLLYANNIILLYWLDEVENVANNSFILFFLSSFALLDSRLYFTFEKERESKNVFFLLNSKLIETVGTKNRFRNKNMFVARC